MIYNSNAVILSQLLRKLPKVKLGVRWHDMLDDILLEMCGEGLLATKLHRLVYLWTKMIYNIELCDFTRNSYYIKMKNSVEEKHLNLWGQISLG